MYERSHNSFEPLVSQFLYNFFYEFVIVRSRIPKVSGLTYKSRAKWKKLWAIYSANYGEVNVSVEKCVEINWDYVEK